MTAYAHAHHTSPEAAGWDAGRLRAHVREAHGVTIVMPDVDVYELHDTLDHQVPDDDTGLVSFTMRALHIRPPYALPVCDTCHVVVLTAEQGEHVAWHLKLREALELVARIAEGMTASPVGLPKLPDPPRIQPGEAGYRFSDKG